MRKRVKKTMRTILQVECLETRNLLNATPFTLPLPIILSLPEVAPVAAAAAAAAALPPLGAGLLGEAAGYLKAAANAVTSNLSSEEITAAANQPQSLTGALVNYAKGEALSLATNTKTFLDLTDATADTLVEGAKTAPSPLSIYIGAIGAAFKVGEADATRNVDEAVLAVDSMKNLVNPTVENAENVAADGRSLVSDLVENFAFNASVDLDNAARDAQEAVKAASAQQAAVDSLLNTLQQSVDNLLTPPSPPPAPTPTPTPQPAPTPTPTPANNDPDNDGDVDMY